MPEEFLPAIMAGLALVSRVFWGPDPEFCRTIHQDGGLIASTAMARLATMAPFSKPIAQIGAAIRSHRDGEALFNDLEARYVSLFISNRQGIAASLYHSSYAGPEGAGGESLLMGEPAVEMRRRLASSGLALDEDLHQLPDHLCIEIEYLYFLLQEGGATQDNSLLAEGRCFAGDWMLPWVRQFQERIRATEETGFYSLVCGLLIELLAAINRLNLEL